jgi:hypothetical protein
MQGRVTPEDVLQMENPSETFLCSLDANIYDIRFGGFRIRDLDSAQVLLDLEREFEPQTDDTRLIHYRFPPSFLDIQTIGTALTFSVGPSPVSNLLMIERHYFKNQLIKSFDFSFPFCIPNTVNTWEQIYEMPRLSAEEKEEIISNPWEMKSDSYFFVDGVLIMHTRAEYNYSGE